MNKNYFGGSVNRFANGWVAQTKFVASGAILMALFQLPAVPTILKTAVPLEAAPEEVINGTFDEAMLSGIAAVGAEATLTGIFLGSGVSKAEASTMVREKMRFVSTRKAYPASLKVIEKHEETIREKARAKGVPEHVALGVALLENGGSETAKSPAGALGVFQLMPGTARSLGLTVSSKYDERRNPVKNITAGIAYLRMNYDRFGDWGLSTWAYHAGEGNVSKALIIYARANHGVKLAGLKNSGQLRRYVEKYGITIHKLLSDPNVKVMTRKLNDDSSGYPYKVIATATLFEESKTQVATSVYTR